MQIGLIAPPWIAVPPPAYGGTQEVIDNLARGLAALGHDVRLFTIGESTCPVPRRWLYRSPAEPMGDQFREAAHVLAAYQALADTDIIHDHTELGPRRAGRRGMSHPPVVTTVHGPVTPQNRRMLAEAARHASIVAISHAHARSFGDIPVAAVIHHGIDLDAYKPGPGDGGYLPFIGRMSPDMGVHHAVRVARRAGWPADFADLFEVKAGLAQPAASVQAAATDSALIFDTRRNQHRHGLVISGDGNPAAARGTLSWRALAPAHGEWLVTVEAVPARDGIPMTLHHPRPARGERRAAGSGSGGTAPPG